jgi:hypothetical protein
MKLMINVKDLSSYKSRDFVPLECRQCGKNFSKPKHYVSKVLGNQYKNITLDFCSKSCHWLAMKKQVVVTCNNCNKQVEKKPSELSKSKHGLAFCNRTCAATYNNKHRVRVIKVDYRSFALKNLKNECVKCGYNRYPNVLQVHHKDRKRNNNKLNNLELLCPTCHQEHHFLENTGAYSK